MTRRTPEQYDWDRLLFDETLLGKHYSERNGTVEAIYVHHMTIVGNGKGSANDACVRVWQTRRASAQLCVDGGHVRRVVPDSKAAWATGNTRGNHRGISVEHANSTAGPDWKVSEKTWKTGARLVAYLHKAHGLGRPVAGKTLKKHKDVRATACPGPYMDSIWGKYVAEAQRVYDEIAGTKAPAKKAPAKKAPATKSSRKRPLIKRGSRGKAVEDAQRAVGSAVDGIFGSKTEAKVEAFQRKHKLVADGIVGSKTWAKIDAGAKAPAPKKRPLIKRGSRGKAVEDAQRAVGASVDGIFGSKTEAAVKRFQRKHKLVADGIVGPKTWARID